MLRRLWETGHRPPFLLFLGPAGVGRSWAARQYAQALLCENPRLDDGACAACGSCLKVERGSHPDCTVIDSAFQERLLEEPRSKSLKIDTVREAMRHFQYRPFEGPCSIAIIDHAENLTDDTQVAMLKVLEESPPHLTWILIAGSEDNLLPTILSRVNAKVHFQLLSDEALSRVISQSLGIEAQAAAQAAALSNGSLLRARRLLERSGIRHASEIKPTALKPADIYALSARSARFRSASLAREQVRSIMEDLELEALASWKKDSSPASLRRLKILLESQRDLDANVTPALILERLLLALHQGK
ncbi:MAG: hypothetical protein HY547_03515 [Elusimicrobia bacterium]|nr:hypothetical protein [Elusimicrobiota bacterium]